jgi:hypothetical protein
METQQVEEVSFDEFYGSETNYIMLTHGSDCKLLALRSATCGPNMNEEERNGAIGNVAVRRTTFMELMARRREVLR